MFQLINKGYTIYIKMHLYHVFSFFFKYPCHFVQPEDVYEIPRF